MTTQQQRGLSHLTDKERRVALEFVRRIRQRFDGQLASAILFGSRARGEAEPDSGMDVLVVMSGAGSEIRREVRHLAVEVWLEHGIYVSTRIWSQAHWRKMEELHTLLYQNIRKDGIDLLALVPAGG